MALLLSGCAGEERYPDHCATRIPGWKQPSDGYSVLSPTSNIRLTRDGSINWNGEQISQARLAEYSAMTAAMNPVPFTILQIEPGAPCDVVIETRRTIDEKAKCRAFPEFAVCGEGPEPWAQVGDVVGPNGEPTRPFYPQKKKPSRE